MRYGNILLILALLCTSGCATVLEGRTQNISLDTIPSGATCILKSNDEVVGVIDQTPGHVLVDKSKYDIVVECSKDGYIKTKMKNRSDIAATSLGNYAMLAYSFIGNGIDNATGAANKYDSRMLLTLDIDKEAKTTQVAQIATPPSASSQPVLLAQEQAIPAKPEKSAMLGKYASVENLATKKPDSPMPSLPSEQAVPYMEVTSAPIGTPAPPLSTPAPPAMPVQTAEANAQPALLADNVTSFAVQKLTNTPHLEYATMAAAQDKTPKFVKTIAKTTATVTPVSGPAAMQLSQLEPEYYTYVPPPSPKVAWYY